MKLNLELEKVVNLVIFKHKDKFHRIFLFKTSRSDSVCLETKDRLDERFYKIYDEVLNELKKVCSNYGIEVYKGQGYLGKDSILSCYIYFRDCDNRIKQKGA